MLRPDGVLQLDVRLTLQTDDGQLIYMTYRGHRHGPADVMDRLGRGEVAGEAQGMGQTRDADGKAGRGHWLRAKARYEAIVPPPTANRAEDDLLPALVGDGEGQLNLEYGAGVIFEPAHDRGVNADAAIVVARQPAQDLGTDLAGATLGIVGFGRIGRALATRAEAFGMQIVHTARSSGVTLDELLGCADVVSLHVPLSPATHHLIDSVALSRMKQSAYLVNTARGGVVDQDALRDALQRRRLAGAALDVTDPEPLPADDPLLYAPNLIVVPHIGSATAGTRARMAAMAVDNLLAALAGEAMPHPAS